LLVALVTGSIPIAYTALAGVAFVVMDAYRTLTHPQDPLT